MTQAPSARLIELSKNINRSKSLFFVLRRTSPEKFEYIFGTLVLQKIKGDPSVLYEKYLDEMQGVKDKLQEICYWLEEREDTNILSFGKWLHKKGIFGNPNTFSSSYCTVLFNSKIGFSSHKTFLKYKRVLAEFPVFKQEVLKKEQKNKQKNS